MVVLKEREAEGGDMRDEDFRFAVIEQKLRGWDLSYEYIPEFSIAEVARNPDSQVRFDKNIAPVERVKEFALQMRNGARFPPIVLRRMGNVLIDGNTRLEASKSLGRLYVDAYMVDLPTETYGRLLAASLNQLGGERLTSQEATEAAQAMLAEGWTPEMIARELGRDVAQMRRLEHQAIALKRAQDLGVGDKMEAIPRSTRPFVGAVALEEPFKELTTLAADAHLETKEVKELAQLINQAPNEEVALQIVRDKRSEMAPSGPPPRAASRREIPTLRLAVRRICGYAGNPSGAFDPRKRDEELALWTPLEAVAREVVAAIKGG